MDRLKEEDIAWCAENSALGSLEIACLLGAGICISLL